VAPLPRESSYRNIAAFFVYILKVQALAVHNKKEEDTLESKVSSSFRFVVYIRDYLPRDIAPVGQTSAHVPHSVHTSGSIL